MATGEKVDSEDGEMDTASRDLFHAGSSEQVVLGIEWRLDDARCCLGSEKCHRGLQCEVVS